MRKRKMARYMLLVAISLTSVCFANTHSATPKEALMLRRITEYWKDGDYGAVKRQIVDFLEKNPDTALYDHLNAMLGDLYFQERDFRQALATYDLIANPEIREKTFFNHLQAHFELRDYLTVVNKAEKYFKANKRIEGNQQIKIRYLLAESSFRHALKCEDMEKKVFYLKLAKPHYKILSQTKYSERVLFPLAEIHRLLREDDRAAALYLNLADKYPEHRERFLFQAGILQIKENKQDAIYTFAKVYEMGGKRSKLAAFNRLVLLYQNENYDDFLQFYDQTIALMPEQKVPLLQFYEGRCYYNLGDYQQAVMPLETFLTTTKGKSKELKTAHLLLVNCSRYLKDTALLERTMYSYKTAFPRDAEVPKILMIHAQLCRENGNLAQALNDLKLLTTDYPGYDETESVLYDYGLLLSQMDRHLEAREVFLGFIEKYPRSEKKSSAWRHLLNCCIEELKDPGQINSAESKETFVKILHQALSQDKVFNEHEKNHYGLVFLKCKCELEQYEEVMPMLEQYVTDVIDPQLLAEAHVLMAICKQKTNSDLFPFMHHAEKALSYNPKLSDNETLHLELYNAYLSQGFSAEDRENQGHFFDHAADHLFKSFAWKEQSIKMDNYLWLANHYYNKGIQGSAEGVERACALYNNLLGIEEGKTNLNITSDTLHLESEVLKYAHLLEVSQRNKEKILVMEMLVRKQDEHHQLPWKLKRRAVLELAKAYEVDGQYQNAINSFQYLVQSAGKAASIVTNTAQLHLAQLEYNLLKPQQRTNENPEMVSILHTLKDLQIQKKLLAEPLHLEAALRYAEIRASLADEEQDAKNTYFFYKRMFDDFHATNDPIAEEYNHLRAQHAEKNAIFGVYMQYLDAQMLKCQAKAACAEKKLDKAQEYEEEAEQILNNLARMEEYTKPYLWKRIKNAR